MSKQTYRDLDIWQQAQKLRKAIDRITDALPNKEHYVSEGRAAEIRRLSKQIAFTIKTGKIKQQETQDHQQADNIFIEYLKEAVKLCNDLEDEIEVAEARFDFTKAKEELNKLKKELEKFLANFKKSW